MITFPLIIIFFKIFNIVTGTNKSTISNNESQRQKRGILNDPSFIWKEKEIFFYVDPMLEYTDVKVALNRIAKETCLRFKRVIDYRQSLFAYIPGKFFETNLGKRNEIPHKIFVSIYVRDAGKIIRETMRALGVDYEHNRIDRNKYITISRRQIMSNYLKYFDLRFERMTNIYGLPYDYRSIMHFSINEYAKSRNSVMRARDKLMELQMGKSKYLTFCDAKLLNKKYCHYPYIPHPFCLYGGYQDPRNPTRCKCLPFLIGNQCQIPLPNSMLCTQENMYFVAENVVTRNLFIARKCSFFLQADSRKKISLRLKFSTTNAQLTSHCTEENSIEVKTQNDLSISGYLFCPNGKELRLISKQNLISIITNDFPFHLILEVSYVQI
ncbi:Astacin-like metalloendopeptidase [Strongyloides ratti]|nr:Astacin-like metalloendopeptidase [Strongyloides ratti]CEF61348.1 Astacin-like metalloendopeptidase [Strongyloides ratti]